MQVVSAVEVPQVPQVPQVPHYLLQNFAVASKLVSNVLTYFGNSKNWSDSVMNEVLLQTHVAARAQAVSYNDHLCLIDGAHTPLSMKEACNWFAEQCSNSSCGVLFYCGHDKHVASLVHELLRLDVREIVVCGVKHPKPEYT